MLIDDSKLVEFNALTGVAHEAKLASRPQAYTQQISANELLIDGYVYDRAAEVVSEFLGDAKGDVRIRVHSPGGSASAGIAIANRLNDYARGATTVVVDGMAASAASLLLQGATRRLINAGGRVMIHDVGAFAFGNANTMRKVADILEGFSDAYAEIHAARGNHDKEYYRAAMRAETWYSADEAVTEGIADEAIKLKSPPQADNTAAASNRQRVQAAALMLNLSNQI